MRDKDLLKELLVVINVGLVWTIFILNILILFLGAGEYSYMSVIIGETLCIPIVNLIAILVWRFD